MDGQILLSVATPIQDDRWRKESGRKPRLTGGSSCNFDERWNPQKLEETLLLLLLGIDKDSNG
jgi:hypothetical protein